MTLRVKRPFRVSKVGSSARRKKSRLRVVARTNVRLDEVTVKSMSAEVWASFRNISPRNLASLLA